MTLQTDLYPFMVSQAGLAALVAARIYPITLPQEPTLPAVTYLLVDDPPAFSHDGLSSSTARLQFDCYGRTYLEAHSLADQVEAAAHAWRKASTRYVAFKAARRDFPEPELARFRVTVDVQVRHGA